MFENKPQTDVDKVSSLTTPQNIATPASVPIPTNQSSTVASNHQHHEVIRIINILYAVSIVFNGALIGWGVLDNNNVGAGFMLLFGIFWAIVGTIIWLIVRLIFWFEGRRPKKDATYLDILDSKLKKKAYISLAISLAQCFLFASYGVGYLFTEVTTGILLIGMFAAPVLSWLCILGIVYAIQVYRTPYKNVAIWAIALQAIPIGVVGLWALVVG